MFDGLLFIYGSGGSNNHHKENLKHSGLYLQGKININFDKNPVYINAIILKNLKKTQRCVQYGAMYFFYKKLLSIIYCIID